MRIVSLILALVMLAGCGRVGPIRPPGPQEELSYPRSYPNR
jgi:predicted small lipoprotein YifL